MEKATETKTEYFSGLLLLFALALLPSFAELVWLVLVSFGVVGSTESISLSGVLDWLKLGFLALSVFSPIYLISIPVRKIFAGTKEKRQKAKAGEIRKELKTVQADAHAVRQTIRKREKTTEILNLLKACGENVEVFYAEPYYADMKKMKEQAELLEGQALALKHKLG